MFPKDHYLPKCYTDKSYNFIIKDKVGWYTTQKKEQARCLINPIALNPLATPTQDTTSPSQHALEWSAKEKKMCGWLRVVLLYITVSITASSNAINTKHPAVHHPFLDTKMASPQINKTAVTTAQEPTLTISLGLRAVSFLPERRAQLVRKTNTT